MAEALLKLQQVTAGYGDAVVLHDVSLELPEHGSLAVLGRNGPALFGQDEIVHCCFLFKDRIIDKPWRIRRRPRANCR